MRIIKIYTTAGSGGELHTDVTTFGALKSLLTSEKGINTSSMKCLVGETKNELSVDDAILPEGNFKLYIVPQQTKSGSSEDIIESIREKIEEIEDLLETLEASIEDAPIKDNTSAPHVQSWEDELAMRDIAKLSR
jgi:hypothetical protein